MDPKLELTFTKCAEIFAESIPSSVLQSYALFGSDRVSKTAIFSVISSCTTIAFVSSTISTVSFSDETKQNVIALNYI